MKRLRLTLAALAASAFPLAAQPPVPIPDWAEAQIAESQQRFEAWRGQDQAVVFPIVTDVHSSRPAIAEPPDFSDSKMHILFACRAAEKFKADFIADLGDIGLDTPATAAPSNAQARLQANVQLFGHAPVPVLFAMGNHDHGRQEFRVTNKLYGELFNGPMKKRFPTCVTGPDCDYGSFDVPEKRCRVFFLNSSDGAYYGFSLPQLQFLADNLRLPAGHSAVVLQHLCVNAIGRWKSYPDRVAHGAVYTKILEDFAAGAAGSLETVSWDFRKNRNARLVGSISGDSHFDRQLTTNGVTYVITQGYGGISPKELSEGCVVTPFSRASAMLIDVAAIKPEKGEFRMFRIGAGGAARDRTFTFPPCRPDGLRR